MVEVDNHKFKLDSIISTDSNTDIELLAADKNKTVVWRERASNRVQFGRFEILASHAVLTAKHTLPRTEHFNAHGFSNNGSLLWSTQSRRGIHTRASIMRAQMTLPASSFPRIDQSWLRPIRPSTPSTMLSKMVSGAARFLLKR